MEDLTRSPYWEAFGEESQEKHDRLIALNDIADKLDQGTATQVDRDLALHILVDLALGRQPS